LAGEAPASKDRSPAQLWIHSPGHNQTATTVSLWASYLGLQSGTVPAAASNRRQTCSFRASHVRL